MASLADHLAVPAGAGPMVEAATRAFAGPSTFGGQLLGQMVAAVEHRTGLQPATVHAQFLRAGRAGTAVRIGVEELHGGRRASRCLVTVAQHDELLVTATLTAVRGGPGSFDQAVPPRALPAREAAADHRPTLFERVWSFEALEFRRVRPRTAGALHPVWLRARDQDAPPAGAAAAFCTDLGVVASALGPDESDRVPVTTDAAIWLVAPSDLREWHLLEASSITRQGAWARVDVRLWTEAGHLAAFAVQTVMVPGPAGDRGGRDRD